jgi:hypothetical protein
MLSLFTFLLSIFSVSSSVIDCSKATALFDLTSMSFSPDPPVKGSNSTLFLSMNVPVEVLGGTATYSVTYNFIPLTPTVKDLCLEAPGGCPLKIGTLDTVSSIPFDGSISGQLVIKIEWKDLEKTQLMCVQIKTTV